VAVDSQSVKASGNAAADSVGFDGNKRIKGRKRHIAVDALGLLIVLGVSAASLADSPVGRQVLTHVATVAPTVSKAWVDGGHNQKVSAWSQAPPGGVRGCHTSTMTLD
jgi:hypothetical protein